MIRSGPVLLSAFVPDSNGGQQQALVAPRKPERAPQRDLVGLKGCSYFVCSESGYKLQSECEERQLFNVLAQDTIHSVELYRSLLKECSERKALAQAKQVHAHLTKIGFEATRFLGECVVDTFVQCGGLKDALDVFWGLPCRTVASWTAVISGCTHAGQGREALRMYHSMLEEGVEPNNSTFVSLLKACSCLADLEQGKRMHVEALTYGCESNLFVGTSLANMYAKCGSMLDAQLIFDSLTQRDVVTWTAMIAGYTHQGQGKEALMLYQRMQEEGVGANNWTYVSAVQACGSLAENEDVVHVGEQLLRVESWQLVKAIHTEIQGKSYLLNEYVGNALVTIYARCGSIADARIVFDGLSQKVVVSWNAMMAAYAQQGLAEEALKLYRQMIKESVSPDARTFVSALQASCSLAENEETVLVNGQSLKVGSLHIGKELHAEAGRRGYELNVFINSILVTVYSTCGNIEDAQNVFNKVSQWDVVSWNSMMVAFAQRGQADKVLQVYIRMLEEGISPDERTLVTMVQACIILTEKQEHCVEEGQMTTPDPSQMGKAMHAEAWRRGYKPNLFISSSLITIYGKCGSILDAQNVFFEVSKLDIMSSNAMLGAYVQQQDAEKVLHLYGQMLEAGVNPDDRTFVNVLQACSTLAEKEVDVVVDGVLTKVESLEKGKVIHAEGWKRGYACNLFFVSSLIGLYGMSGGIVDVQNLFDGLSQRDVISWNAVLGAYAQQGQADKALQVYIQMLEEGLNPDDRTFASMFQACGMLAHNEEDIPKQNIDEEFHDVEALQIGKTLHGEAWKRGYRGNVFVGSSLVSMYAKCMSIADAENVFDGLSRPNVVLWNAMLAGYLHHGQPHKAWQLYGRLREEGLSPDDRTFVSALQACGMLVQNEEKGTREQPTKVELLHKGEAIHAEAWNRGYKSDPFVGNALISMYGKVGNLVAAQEVFDGLSQRNVVSWNAMLATYTQQGQADRTLQLYRRMKQDGVSPNEITFVCILGACCTTGSLDICVNVHHDIVSSEIRFSSLVANSLIHAYGRCASMVEARKVFDHFQKPNLLSWNALIAGHARQGNSKDSLQCYKEMLLAGVRPDGVTFLSILSLCSHAGLVKEGIEYFEAMSRNFGITPEIHHYASMVDLLGRAGHFTAIENLLSHMPMSPTSSMWLCLLAACRKHGNVVLAKRAFDMAVSMHPNEAAAYVLMSNIYAQAGMWDFATHVNELRKKAGAWKEPGESWIEHKQEAHTFMVRDHDHPQEEQLYFVLGQLHSFSEKDHQEEAPLQDCNCHHSSHSVEAICRWASVSCTSRTGGASSNTLTAMLNRSHEP